MGLNLNSHKGLHSTYRGCVGHHCAGYLRLRIRLLHLGSFLGPSEIWISFSLFTHHIMLEIFVDLLDFSMIMKISYLSLV
jgi:hypothetical protein